MLKPNKMYLLTFYSNLDFKLNTCTSNVDTQTETYKFQTLKLLYDSGKHRSGATVLLQHPW